MHDEDLDCGHIALESMKMARRYWEWEDSDPQAKAEAQARFSALVAYVKSPEGQAETERLRVFYAGLPRVGGPQD